MLKLHELSTLVFSRKLFYFGMMNENTINTKRFFIAAGLIIMVGLSASLFAQEEKGNANTNLDYK